MRHQSDPRLLWISLLVLVISGHCLAGGFQISEQGVPAMGMANAFTAQADDPSAIYFNAAGLAFMREQAFMAGTIAVSLGDTSFRGAGPFPGPGVQDDQVDHLIFPSHFFWVRPLSNDVTFGFGVTTPFGLISEWPTDFAGRFVSRKVDLKTLDLSPVVAWRPRPKIGVSFGVVLRLAMLELQRSSAAINPFTFQAEEVALLKLESDLESAPGWSVGLLHRASERVTWGFSYSSGVDMDFGGDARLTQVFTGDALFDAEVADEIPFDQDLPVSTGVDFPHVARFGVAVKVRSGLLVEVDLHRTGWSSFSRTEILFPANPDDDLDTEIESNWDDVNSYRAGLRWQRKGEWRFGAYFDENAQPRETLGPLLPDADRRGYSAGYGRAVGKYRLDFALMYIDFRDRGTLTNVEGFNGVYGSKIWLFGVGLRS